MGSQAGSLPRLAISPNEPLHAQRAANIIVSMSLGTSFLAFGMAELRTSA